MKLEQLCEDPEIWKIEVFISEHNPGALNVYLLRSDGESLVIDTGSDRTESYEELCEGLRELQVDLSHTSLFLTHIHNDHASQTKPFMDKKCPIYIGKYDRRANDPLAAYIWMAKQGLYLAREGVPVSELFLRIRHGLTWHGVGIPPFKAHGVVDGERLKIGNVELVCLHTPGHTPGHTALYLPEQRILFSGDVVLYGSTPVLSPWRRGENTMKNYLNSLETVRNLPVDLLLPGHGPYATVFSERIDELAGHYLQSAARFKTLVEEFPGKTLWELTKLSKEKRHHVKWSDIIPMVQILHLWRNLSLLRYLVEEGQLRRESAWGVCRYYPCGNSDHC